MTREPAEIRTRRLSGGCPWTTSYSRTWPGEPEQTRHWRASDGERHAVLRDLGEHLEAGRLDLAEFEERSERVLGARTRGDLSDVVADLPPLRMSEPWPRQERRTHPWAILLAALAIVAALTLTAALWAEGHFFFPGFLIPIGLLATRGIWRRWWIGPARTR